MIFGNGVCFIEYFNFEIGDLIENYLLRSIGILIVIFEGRIFLVNELENKEGGRGICIS